MDADSELERVAAAYRCQGYTVVTHPTADDLPPFARDFRVEIVARRADEGVLAIVKQSRQDLAAATDAPRYAEATASQRGWRVDLVVLGAESASMPHGSAPGTGSGADVVRSTDQAEKLINTDYAQMAVVAAWAAFESASRVHLRRLGPHVNRDTRAGDISRELYSAGLLSPQEFAAARAAYRLVQEVVHGIPTGGIETKPEYATLVCDLTGAARRLSEAPVGARQPA